MAGTVLMAVERDRNTLRSALTEKGNGSFLRGWRRELDPDGSLDIGIEDFNFAAKQRLAVDVNSQRLCKLSGDASQLSLLDIAPSENELIQRLRSWIKTRFGSPEQFFSSISSHLTDGSALDQQGFQSGCLEHGFEATTEELDSIFSWIDIDEGGSINCEEVLFLEEDNVQRDLALHNEKMKLKGQRERLLAYVYLDDVKKGALSRAAPKPWMAGDFEKLPPLAILKKQLRQKEQRQQSIAAKAKFLQHLSKRYGSCARGWRRGIHASKKEEGRWMLRRMDLRHFCSRDHLDVDIKILWSTLDSDADEQVNFHDVAPKAAAALASFKVWTNAKCGSCSAAWNLPHVKVARSTPQSDGKLASKHRLFSKSFLDSIKAEGWQGSDKGAEAEMCSALDFFNVGMITQEDLQWLDTWNPPTWLTESPSQEAWETLKAHLLSKHEGNALKAWRHIDFDGTNEVCWLELEAACKDAKFTGNVGAAWRYIDSDASGSISMEEFSSQDFELLMSFKAWAVAHFGSVCEAFKTFDADGSGSLTLGEMKRACNKRKWLGDVKMLFDSLGSGQSNDGNKRVVKLLDLAFLDKWPEKEDENEVEEEVSTGIFGQPESPSKASARALQRSASSGQIRSRPATASGSPKVDARPFSDHGSFSQRPSSANGYPKVQLQPQQTTAAAHNHGRPHRSSPGNSPPAAEAPTAGIAATKETAKDEATLTLLRQGSPKKSREFHIHKAYQATKFITRSRARSRRGQQPLGKGKSMQWLDKVCLATQESPISVACPQGDRPRRALSLSSFK
eukprot:TRINITY_DN48581_c0_g1_i1.p1 TRINITY_DN48581_c0_g1~~TRINITY_DN48581_c0_g1_i1.p1  ORF type:complete len:790 (-),score=149.86 TRINITY_DN48581_c0_g1_i1:368-2737(-)